MAVNFTYYPESRVPSLEYCLPSTNKHRPSAPTTLPKFRHSYRPSLASAVTMLPADLHAMDNTNEANMPRQLDGFPVQLAQPHDARGPLTVPIDFNSESAMSNQRTMYTPCQATSDNHVADPLFGDYRQESISMLTEPSSAKTYHHQEQWQQQAQQQAQRRYLPCDQQLHPDVRQQYLWHLRGRPSAQQDRRSHLLDSSNQGSGSMQQQQQQRQRQKQVVSQISAKYGMQMQRLSNQAPITVQHQQQQQQQQQQPSFRHLADQTSAQLLTPQKKPEQIPEILSLPYTALATIDEQLQRLLALGFKNTTQQFAQQVRTTPTPQLHANASSPSPQSINGRPLRTPQVHPLAQTASAAHGEVRSAASLHTQAAHRNEIVERDRLEEEQQLEHRKHAERRAELRSDASAIYRNYNEYLDYFPLARGERPNPYLVGLLANQSLPAETTSDLGLAILYAKQHWENFWDMGDLDLVVEKAKQKIEQNMEARQHLSGSAPTRRR